VDPIEARRAERAEQAAMAGLNTFAEVAEAYVAAHEAGWKNPKHRQQWRNTLATYAFPVLGRLGVAAIGTAEVTRVLEPVWREKPETASRVRGRIEAVLDYAAARGWRAGENPARWRGHLDTLLPARSKVRKVEHHPALPYAELPGFLIELRRQEGIAARALEFTILTAARTGETIGATSDEINSTDKIWTVPAARMKAAKEHRVPLCARALEILDEMSAGRGPGKQFMFPGGRRGRPLSNMGMAMTLRRMGRDDLTVHGFRSSFRDWAAERTNFPSEVVEMGAVRGGESGGRHQRNEDEQQARRQVGDDHGVDEADPMCDPARRA